LNQMGFVPKTMGQSLPMFPETAASAAPMPNVDAETEAEPRNRPDPGRHNDAKHQIALSNAINQPPSPSSPPSLPPGVLCVPRLPGHPVKLNDRITAPQPRSIVARIPIKSRGRAKHGLHFAPLYVNRLPHAV